MKTPQEWNAYRFSGYEVVSIEAAFAIQADARAELLERIEKLRKLVEDIDLSDLFRHHPWHCPNVADYKMPCTCGFQELQQRINEALEQPVPPRRGRPNDGGANMHDLEGDGS